MKLLNTLNERNETMTKFTGTDELKTFELKRLFSMRQSCVELGLSDSADLYSLEYCNLRDKNLVGQPVVSLSK